NIAKGRWLNWDGTVQEYPTYATDHTPWKNALNDWLARIKATLAGKPIYANIVASRSDGSDWDMFLPNLDGAMDEGFAVGYPPDYLPPEQFEGALTQAEKVMAQGKGLLAVAQGPQEDAERMRFGLASFMLV